MTQTPRFTPAERPAKLQEALNYIGSWLLGTVKAEPGWNELVLDIKPLTDTVFVRITESRDDHDYVGSVGPLRSDSRVLPEIEKLQHAAYDEHRGTWFSATVVIAAKDWPHPDYQIGAAYHRQVEPENWEGEGRLTSRELRAHLELFPRDEDQIPEWARVRLQGRRSLSVIETSDGFEVPNPYLVSALESIVPGQRTDAGVINVLRASLGGDLLLDISDSDFTPGQQAESGAEPVIRSKVLRLANNMRALCVYSSSEHLLSASDLQEAQGAAEEPAIMRDSSTKIYTDFLQDETLDLVVVDPGTPHETFIEKPQIGWVISTPFNDGAKRALMEGNMQQLLATLVSPGAFLLMGVRVGTDSPIFVPSDTGEDPDTMLAFTSAVEVASVDPQLQVRSAPALDVLKFAVQLGASSLRINATNPSGTLPIEQIRELVEIVDSAAS